MATKKRASRSRAPKDRGVDYNNLLAEYGRAMQKLQKRDFVGAADAFKALLKQTANEPELHDRANTYLATCITRINVKSTEPKTADQRYHNAVLALNAGRHDEARTLLDQVLTEKPSDASALYARACLSALGSDAASSVRDLRAAIALDPKLRFQAVNDADFQPIRDDAAFIDIIEPSLTGV